MQNLRETISESIIKKNYPGLDGVLSVVNNSIRVRLTWKTEAQAVKFANEIKDVVRPTFHGRLYVWVQFINIDEVTDRRIKFNAPKRAPEFVIGEQRNCD